MTANLDRNIS